MGKISENQQKNVRFTFKKEERLCSKRLFDQLFAEGHSFLVYPLKVVYKETAFSGNYPAKVAFAVRKKIFKSAVRRNRIKRLMRETYRLNKHWLYRRLGEKRLAIVFIYVGKEQPGYGPMEKAMKKGLSKMVAHRPG